MIKNYFATTHTFDQRVTEHARLRQKYPHLIAVICEPNDKNKLFKSTRVKFLVPNELTVGQFIWVLRKRIGIESNEALFLFTASNNLVPTGYAMDLVYRDHHNDDGFLYFKYANENTFGELTPRPTLIVPPKRHLYRT